MSAPVQEPPTAYKSVPPVPSAASRSARPVVVPYECGTHPRRRARRLGAPVQELPTVYKSVRLYCLPLRGRHAQWSCPTNVERTLAVGRDDSARRCRNYQMRTDPQSAENPAATVYLFTIHDSPFTIHSPLHRLASFFATAEDSALMPMTNTSKMTAVA